MKKKEIVKIISKKAQITLKQANDVYEIIINEIKSSVKDKGHYEIKDIGKFTISKRKGKFGRHFTTDRIINISTTNRVKFIASKKINEVLSKKKKKGTDDTGPRRF